MEEQILEILQNVRPEVDFKSQTNFIENSFLDSLDVIRVIIELDALFGIKISGVDIVPENFNTLKAIKALVEKKQNSKFIY